MQIINKLILLKSKSPVFWPEIFRKNFFSKNFVIFLIEFDAELWEMRKNNVFHASHFLAYLLMSCVLRSCVLMSLPPTVLRPTVLRPNVSRPNVLRPNVSRPNVPRPNVCVLMSAS